MKAVLILSLIQLPSQTLVRIRLFIRWHRDSIEDACPHLKSGLTWVLHLGEIFHQ